MNIEVAYNAMNLIAMTGKKGMLDNLGISRKEFDRLVSDEPWIGADRNRMTTVLHTLINASVDYMNVPRFDLFAEFMAAGIAVFVSGVNMMSACVFAASIANQPVEAMGRMAVVTPMSPNQIFALVMQLCSGSGRSAARAQFEKNSTLALEKVSMYNVGDSAK